MTQTAYLDSPVRLLDGAYSFDFGPTNPLPCLSAASYPLIIMPSWVERMKEARRWLEDRRAARANDPDNWFVDNS